MVGTPFHRHARFGDIVSNQGTEWIAADTELGSMRMVLIMAYMKVGVGFHSGEDIKGRTEIEGYIKMKGLPYIIIADWNVEAKDIDPLRLKRKCGRIWLPSGTNITCRSGKGRILDYAVIAYELEAMVHEVLPVHLEAAYRRQGRAECEAQEDLQHGSAEEEIA